MHEQSDVGNNNHLRRSGPFLQLRSQQSQGNPIKHKRSLSDGDRNVPNFLGDFSYEEMLCVEKERAASLVTPGANTSRLAPP